MWEYIKEAAKIIVYINIIQLKRGRDGINKNIGVIFFLKKCKNCEIN